MRAALSTIVAVVALMGFGVGGCGTEPSDDQAAVEESQSALCTPDGCTFQCLRPALGEYQSYYSGANCTGTEYSDYSGSHARYTWDGAGCMGAVVQLPNYYWVKSANGNCFEYPIGCPGNCQVYTVRR